MKKKIVVMKLFVLILIPINCLVFAQASKEIPQQKELIVLEEIVVVASRESEEIIRIPANVTVITAEDIERSTAKEITELLREEAGIMVTNTSGSTPTGITVEARGFNNGGGNGGRTLVLVDGWKANEADSSNPDWALIPLHNIDRIEVVRGPATAIYGDSAMAAVINIITKKGIGRPIIELGADAGSWQTYGQRATVQGSTQRFSYFLFGSRSEEDGYRDNSNFTAQDWTGNLSYQLTPAIELTLKAGYHTDDRELPGSLTRNEIQAVGRRGSVVAGEDKRETDQFNTVLGVDIIPDEYNKFSMLFYYNNNEGDSLTSIPGSGSTTIDDDEDDYSLSLRYASTYEIFGRENKAILGIDLIKEEVGSTSFSNFPDPLFPFIQRQTTKYERELSGVYFHDDFSITDRIILGAGIRFDRAAFDFSSQTENLISGTTSRTESEKDFDRLSPKATVTYLFTDNMSAYFSYAKTFRFPNRDELTGFFGFTPELCPEKGENFEAGMKTRFGPKFSSGISLYHMTVEDEILFRAPNVGAFAFGQNENFDEVVHRGIEISAESSIIPRTTLFGSYTFVDTEIEEGPFKGSDLPITPRHLGYIGANIDFGDGFTLWNRARFVGKRFLANDLANTFDKLPGYGVWDAKLSYAYQDTWGDFSAFFGLNNILDKEYEEFGGIGGYPFGSRIGFFPSPERGFVVGVTFGLRL
jgi:iron complex outermembrane receptor protein